MAPKTGKAPKAAAKGSPAKKAVKAKKEKASSSSCGQQWARSLKGAVLGMVIGLPRAFCSSCRRLHQLGLA